ncbi:unnamed protein product [Linum trigynum]|uniref:Retrotransposon Copia-like N-terminal domain-containing protein n=1 Tax=Linum trigynum TaxID=586398 RepID=A0AAV2G0E6_9ROSI
MANPLPLPANLDPNHPHYLNQNENPALVLVSTLLHGGNYQSWARSMRMALLAKNKVAFVNGDAPRPGDADPLLPAWERANLMVLGWLYCSLEPTIAQSILWLDSAREVWLDLQERFGQANLVRISDLHEEIYGFKQGNLTVTEYYTRFKVLWDEFFALRPLPGCTCTPRCRCGAFTRLRGYVEADQIIRFLRGLRDSFGPIRSQILQLDPLPPINRVFAQVVQQERESRHGASLVPTVQPPMAFAAPSSSAQGGRYTQEGASSSGCHLDLSINPPIHLIQSMNPPIQSTNPIQFPSTCETSNSSYSAW